MSTAHNAANLNDIAKVVLMPGDPLRAKFIANKYLSDVVQFNDIRNMFGYTGYYKGKRISIMGSGMGCGSIGIYSHELYNKYDVDVIIRVGSCGAYIESLKPLDVLIVEDSYSESTYAKTYSGKDLHLIKPSSELINEITDSAFKFSIKAKLGRIHTSDCFYHKVSEELGDLVDNKKCIGVDMESFALFHNANEASKKAACLLTVSDNIITKEKVNALDREQCFNEMIEIALDVAIKYA